MGGIDVAEIENDVGPRRQHGLDIGGTGAAGEPAERRQLGIAARQERSLVIAERRGPAQEIVGRQDIERDGGGRARGKDPRDMLGDLHLPAGAVGEDPVRRVRGPGEQAEQHGENAIPAKHSGTLGAGFARGQGRGSDRGAGRDMMAAMASERDSDWKEYYERTAGRPPRRTLLLALERFGPGGGQERGRSRLRRRARYGGDAAPGLAGARHRCGAGGDRAPGKRRTDLAAGAALETRCQRFEDADWPAVDLVNASFSLPLCPPARFPGVWARICRSLKPGGRFSGQLFGERDEWRGESDITFHSRAAIDRLLAGFAVELLEEEESAGPTPYGKPKHWHLFHIVARKD